MGEAPHTAGGALSNGKLKLATATAADVASGKTFYAGDKVIKTGEYTPTLKRVSIGWCRRHSYGDAERFILSAKSVPNYTKLTATNFAMHVTDFYATGDCNGVGEQACSLSYAPSTGTVTVKLGIGYGYKYAGCTVTVYCYYAV